VGISLTQLLKSARWLVCSIEPSILVRWIRRIRLSRFYRTPTWPRELPHMLCPSNHSRPTLRAPNPRRRPPPRASCRRLLRPPSPIVCAAAGPLVLLRRHRPGHSRRRRPFPNLPQRRLQNPFRRRRCGAPPSPAASQGLPRPLPLVLRSQKHQNGRR
jgi:hypothetical protein